MRKLIWNTVSPWTLILVLSAVATGLLALLTNDGPARVVVVFWFLLVCPGMTLVRFFHLGEPLLEWTLAIALSLAADTFVGGLLLYSGRWSPTGAVAILLALTIGGALIQELNAMRTRGRHAV